MTELTPVLEETLAVFDGSGEPLTTPEIADALDDGRRTVYARLQRLVDAGYLQTKKVGANARVWWQPGTVPDRDHGIGGHDSQEEATREHAAKSQLSFCRQRVMDEAPAGITVTDPTQPDNPIIYANDKFQEVTGYSVESALGRNCRFLQGADTDDEPVAEISEAVANAEDVTVELRNYRADGTEFWNQVSITPVRDEEGSVVNFVGFQQDITERKQLERERKIRVRQQEVVAELGKEALEDHDLETLLADAAGLIAETLDTDYCKILELKPTADELLLRQGVGWDDGTVGEKRVSAVDTDSQAAYTLTSSGPVVVEDLETDTRFSGPELLRSHDITCGISTIIGSPDDPWGVLGTHDTGKKAFSEQDVSFVQSVANILATAINRQQDKEKLQQQREELVTLVNLNTIVHETTEAVIAKSTREEIEQAVCQQLVRAKSYKLAWLAGIGSSADTLEPRAWAGETASREIPSSVAAGDPVSQGPAGTAIREQEIQVLRHGADESLDGLSGGTDLPEFESLAMIPIVHEGTVYGVLGVYTDRPNAFKAAEQTVISRLGEVVGYAIAAVERKRALASEDVVELTFRIKNLFDELPGTAQPAGTITFDEVIPVKKDSLLVYGTATAVAREQIPDIVEAVPRWESVTFQEPDGDSAFELKLSDHPVLSTLLSLGGSHESSVIEDGDYRLTVQLAPSANVRRLVDTVQESYPSVEMITRRQTTRETRYEQTAQNSITESLTDRQRTALRAAYHAGLFEWPRDSTGESVADALGIASPTFHHHLRKAEKKVFQSVLSADQVAPPE